MTPARIIPDMIIGPADERPALASIAERLATGYHLLLAREDPTLDPALDALFDALAGLDTLAGGLTAPAVRATLEGS